MSTLRLEGVKQGVLEALSSRLAPLGNGVVVHGLGDVDVAVGGSQTGPGTAEAPLSLSLSLSCFYNSKQL
eukprot:1195344-Prorocentrum_minimum.AAC.4